MLEVTHARPVDGYRIEIRFSSGESGIVDLADSLCGPVFEPLRQPERFAAFTLSPRLHTIAWGDDEDFAPEYLRDKMIVTRACAKDRLGYSRLPAYGHVLPRARRSFGLPELSSPRSQAHRIGSIGAPFLVPVCPDDGFVVYKNRFSEREKTLLRDWARSREFKIAIQRKSTYFRMALIQEKLSEPALDIAHSYLAASWEVEFDAARYSRYVGLALAKLQVHLQGASFDTPSKQDRSIRAESMLLAAELNRRIGRFDEARRLLLDIPGDLAAERKDIIDYELALLDRRDSEPHYLPRDEDARCAKLDRKHPEPAPRPSDAYVPPPPTRSPGPLPAHKLRR